MTILLLVFVLAGADRVRADLIVNGDFSSGGTGFSTTYTYTNTSSVNLTGAQTYTIINDPLNAHVAFSSYGDHTTGDGPMMVVNGAVNSGVTVWSETVSVSQNVDYTFTAWVSSCYPLNPANLNFLINNVSIGTMNAPPVTGIWDDFVGIWDSGSATSATIKIVDLSTANDGNDFALDDISFTPEPASLLLVCVATPFVLKRRKLTNGRR
jgi:hypothetical protein